MKRFLMLLNDLLEKKRKIDLQINEIIDAIIPIVVCLGLVMLVGKGIFYNVTIDNEQYIDGIITQHNGEDRYTGIGGRASVEEELDYMILKYSSDLVKPTVAIEEDNVDDLTDGELIENDEIIDEQQELINYLSHAMASEPDYIRFSTNMNISPDYLFEILFDLACYANGEDGILVDKASYSYKAGMNGATDYKITIYYNESRARLEQIIAETETAFNKVVDTFDFEGKSELQKITMINEYICDTVDYPENEPYSNVSHTAYGAFVEQSAVCDGYARATDMLCDYAGIDCRIVIGDIINSGGHAWNLVKIDGKWYQLDVCWNDTGGNRQSYFLVTDKVMSESRVWNKENYPDVSRRWYY